MKKSIKTFVTIALCLIFVISAFAPINANAQTAKQEIELSDTELIAKISAANVKTYKKTLEDEALAEKYFNAEEYLRKYYDLKLAFGDDKEAAVKHYLSYGLYEGRTGCAKFDPVAAVFVYPSLVDGKDKDRYNVEVIQKKFCEKTGSDTTDGIHVFISSFTDEYVVMFDAARMELHNPCLYATLLRDGVITFTQQGQGILNEEEEVSEDDNNIAYIDYEKQHQLNAMHNVTHPDGTVSN